MAVNPIDEPFIVLDGTTILAMFIGAVALMLFATYSICNHVWTGIRNPVGNIPLAGGALQGAGDAIISQLRGMARGANYGAMQAFNQALQGLHTLQSLWTAVVVNPVIGAHNWLVGAHNALDAHVRNWVDPVAGDAYNTSHNNSTVIDRELRPGVSRAQGTADAVTADVNGRVKPAVSQAQSTADGAVAHANTLDGRLTRLEAILAPILPVVSALAVEGTWPLDLPGRVGTLEQGLEGLRTRLGLDEGQLARVLPLAGLAALGAAAIANAEALARDPCFCLDNLNLSDIAMRVEALENLGS